MLKEGKGELAKAFDGFFNSLECFILTVFFAGVVSAAALWFGVPWLWGLAKPWLHSITG